MSDLAADPALRVAYQHLKAALANPRLRETVLNLSGWRERGFYGESYRVKQDIGDADLAARLGKTLDHEISVQELPLLCRHFLEGRATDGDRSFTFTEEDMRGHAGVRAAAQLAAEQKKTHRKPPEARERQQY